METAFKLAASRSIQLFRSDVGQAIACIVGGKRSFPAGSKRNAPSAKAALGRLVRQKTPSRKHPESQTRQRADHSRPANSSSAGALQLKVSND